MFKIKTFTFLFCASLTANANAVICTYLTHIEPYRNISTAGYATKTEPLIACSVIDATNAGYGAHLIMSEAENGDAILEIKYDKSDYPIRILDNWTSDLDEADKRILGIVREPKRNTDAAIILTSKIPYLEGSSIPLMNSTFGMCIYGYPKEGKDWISLSITYMGNNQQASQNCYTLPNRYFQE